MPWPISSRLEWWRVRVIESATSEVSRLSMLPSTPRVMPSSSTVVQVSSVKLGSAGTGSPAGMSPITGTCRSAAADSALIATSATRGAGTIRLTVIGVRNTISRVSPPSSRASEFTLASTPGSASTAASGEDAGATPSSGALCSSTMITPMPLMKPETTG